MSSRKLTLEINNIGPLKNINANFDTNSLKTILFANNGSGKTFISRCFKILSDLQQEKDIMDLKHLINFDETEASFSFDYSDINRTNIFSFKASKDKIIEKELNSELIIHVFNSDFVSTNVATNNYALNSNSINGEILIGDENIDITKDEDELSQLKQDKMDLEQKLNKEVEDCRNKLSELGIRQTLSEFTNITFEKLLAKTNKYAGISFEIAKDNYDKIKNIPENLPMISKLNYTLAIELFTEIFSALKKQITLSSIGEEFKKKISNKKSFIQTGLDLMKSNNSVCPFCEQPLQEKKDLIDNYIAYFKQEEAKFDEELQQLLTRVIDFPKNIVEVQNEYNKIKLLYADHQKYFADIKNIKLQEFPEYLQMDTAVKNIQTLINEKISNKNKTEFDIYYEEEKNIIYAFLTNLNNFKEKLNKKIDEIEKKKNYISKEQREAKRPVCDSAFGELYNQNLEKINKYKTLSDDILKKEKEITDKKASNKIAKREVVNDEFEKYIKIFFNDKFKFDKQKQSLFLNEHIIENAESFLSDGEKSMIAFCYYLALVHEKVNTQSNYEKLLFVIDDPVSSMDYHYVYQVADIIRNLNKRIGKGIASDKYRYFILTHNYEFFNLLLKNKIPNLKLMLNKNNLSNLKDEIILPYTEHLKIVNNAAQNPDEITFITLNSIRHVLETIANFCYPDKKLIDFLTSENILSESDYVYTAIQDLSHGGLRCQKPYTNEDIQKGCKKIIDYINEHFKGQVDRL